MAPAVTKRPALHAFARDDKRLTKLDVRRFALVDVCGKEKVGSACRRVKDEVAGRVVITAMCRGGTSIMYFSIQNVPAPDAAGRPTAYVVPASVGYVHTLGVRLIAGRAFTDADRADAEPVAIVDELLVRRFLGGRDPLTQHVLLADDTVPRRIVGWCRPLGWAGSTRTSSPRRTCRSPRSLASVPT